MMPPCPALLLTVALFSQAPAQAEGPLHRQFSAVPFTEVKLQDEFWALRIQTNREKSLPHNFKWCEQTGRISNFAKAAGLVPGKFEGIYFNDSDVYKVLEGAAYSLADRRDPELEKTVDEVIAKIAAAQQKDGYLNCYYTLVEPTKRWTNLPVMHELYCSGHLMEAAVAHYRATGKKTFLDVAVKLADHIDRTFGPDKKLGVPGHEEIELALVKLYQATNEERYFKLAKFFIDLRGDGSRRKLDGEYDQDHMPVRKQSEIVGHAVRAMYLYSGVADVAAFTGDKELIGAMGRLWRNVVEQKMYVTGGIGARHAGEAFGAAYELPNDSAYCETCAAIGLALWAHRLNLLHGDAQYADVLERTIYNGILSGIALDGQHFFYVNPLASNGGHHRQPFFGCACCPSNVVRFVPSIPGYVYATTADAIYVNLYAAGSANVSLGGKTVKLTQATRYPWDGKVKISVGPQTPTQCAIALRVPGWCKQAKIVVNGETIEKPELKKGYAVVNRQWKAGDAIELDLAMPVERIEAHPAVRANAGRVAIQRGPIVYCFEAVDNGGKAKNIVLPHDPKFATEHRKDLLGGVTVVKAVDNKGRAVTAVPYYSWDHRQPGEMLVWARQEGKRRNVGQVSNLPGGKPVPGAAKDEDPAWQGKLYRALDPATLGPAEPPTEAELTTVTASHCHSADAVEALNDGVEPKNSNDHDIPRFTWWDHRGSKEWVQYEFPAARKVSAVSVYWFDDTRRHGQCRVPESWRLLAKDGTGWKPVAGESGFGTELDKYNRAALKEVETSALRIEVQLKKGFSAGILEWKVE
jgi:DUF1680 family protein